MPTVNIRQVLEERIRPMGINVFTGGRETVAHEPLKAEEEEAVNKAVDMVARLLGKVSPDLARQFRNHLDVFKFFGGVAKAMFPESKPISFPSQEGHIGIIPLIPQVIKYVATPSATSPAYTSYNTNSWEMDLTAGTAAYIFGDGTNFYKANPATDQHTLLVVIQDGVIEVGSTPKIDQFKIYTSISQPYGIYAAQPLTDITVEPSKTIYQYPTLGAIPVYHDLGIMWEFMPKYSGTSVIKLLGLAFVEHGFLSDLKWIS